MDRDVGLALAGQVKGHVISMIDRRMADMPKPDVQVHAVNTVDTAAIAEALREALGALAPVIAHSTQAGQDIRAQIAEVISGWARDDAGIIRAIEGREVDLSGLADAIGQIAFADYTPQLEKLAKGLSRLALEVGELRAETAAQTAAIKDQTARIEAATRATRSVSYDADGRVTQIRVGT